MVIPEEVLNSHKYIPAVLGARLHAGVCVGVTGVSKLLDVMPPTMLLSVQLDFKFYRPILSYVDYKLLNYATIFIWNSSYSSDLLKIFTLVF